MELLKKDRGADIKAGLFMGESNTWAVVWEHIIECVFSVLERKGLGSCLFTGFAQSCTRRLTQRWREFMRATSELRKLSSDFLKKWLLPTKWGKIIYENFLKSVFNHRCFERPQNDVFKVTTEEQFHFNQASK